MRKRNKIIIAVISAIIIIGAIFGYYIFRKSSTIIPKTDIILFYGRECPHCKDVEKFLTDNKIAEELKFEQAEVWHNKENADLLRQKAKDCGMGEDKIRVPFLYANGKCYVGTPDVENFFKYESGI